MESETQETSVAGAGEQEGSGRPAAGVETPVAKPVPRRGVLTRRLFILGGFWSTLGLALVGLLGPSLDFAWTRNPAGAAREVFVGPDAVPEPGSEPMRIPEGRFFLLNLEAGTTPNGEQTEGGLLALWQKCPHLGCSVPWRADYTFLGRTGWFRCPCHGSTYTREGGIIVAGPAPRPMDTFPLEVQQDGSVVVSTGVNVAVNGSSDPETGNLARTVPYDAAAASSQPPETDTETSAG